MSTGTGGEAPSADSMGGFVFHSLDKIRKLCSKSRDKELLAAVNGVMSRVWKASQQVRAEARGAGAGGAGREL